MNWTPQASGVQIRAEVADALETVWAQRTGIGTVRGPDEITSGLELIEGGVRSTVVNAYERNGEARRQCLAHYGTSCFICKFSFGKNYGDFAKGYIHVHHLRPVSTIKSNYIVDPIVDLRPLCPNCHAAIHLSGKIDRPEELRAAMLVKGDG